MSDLCVDLEVALAWLAWLLMMQRFAKIQRAIEELAETVKRESGDE